jgi:hypothetical protein
MGFDGSWEEAEDKIKTEEASQEGDKNGNQSLLSSFPSTASASKQSGYSMDVKVRYPYFSLLMLTCDQDTKISAGGPT